MCASVFVVRCVLRVDVVCWLSFVVGWSLFVRFCALLVGCRLLRVRCCLLFVFGVCSCC